MSIDTGGVPIVEMDAPLHEVEERRDGDDRVMIALADRKTIPNRDFVLRWRLKDDAIAESFAWYQQRPPAPLALDTGFEDQLMDGRPTMALGAARIAEENERGRRGSSSSSEDGGLPLGAEAAAEAVRRSSISALRRSRLTLRGSKPICRPPWRCLS